MLGQEPPLQGGPHRAAVDALEPAHDDDAEDDDLFDSGGADPATIGAVLRRLLALATDGPACRAWAVFLAEELSLLPSCPPDVAAAVIDLAVGSVQVGDSLVPSRTPLDRSIARLLRSPWRTTFRERAATAFLEVDLATRRRLAVYLFSTVDPPPLLDGTEATEAGAAHLEGLASRLGTPGVEGVLASTDLLETLYQGLRRLPFEYDPYVPPRPAAPAPAMGAELADRLIESIEQGHPTAVVDGWSLVWLTLARYPGGDGRALTPTRRARLRALVHDDTQDARLRTDLAQVLAVEPEVPPVYLQRNWIYEWAVTADTGSAAQIPPLPSAAFDDPDVAAVAALVDDLTSDRYRGDAEATIWAGVAATALARLGGGRPASSQLFLDRFLKPSLDEPLRDEALVHLCRGGEPVLGDETRATLVDLVRSRRDDNETFEEWRALLAVVGLGDVTAIEALLGDGRMIQHYDRALLRALRASPNPRGREALAALTSHPDERVRRDATAELTQP